MLAIALTCKAHRGYQAKRRPQANCDVCWDLWQLSPDNPNHLKGPHRNAINFDRHGELIIQRIVIGDTHVGDYLEPVPTFNDARRAQRQGREAAKQEHDEVMRAIGHQPEGDGQEHGVIMDAILGRD